MASDKWPLERLVILRNHYASKTEQELTALIGLPWKEIETKAKKLQIKRVCRKGILQLPLY